MFTFPRYILFTTQNSEAIVAVVDSSLDPKNALAMFQVWGLGI